MCWIQAQDTFVLKLVETLVLKMIWMKKNGSVSYEKGKKGYYEPFQTTASGGESEGGSCVSGAPHHLSPAWHAGGSVR